jgi:hydrogenase maturation protease
MQRILIIGYGNIDRADDGVAYEVINALRQRLRQKELEEDDTGLDEIGGPVDSVFLSQLVPELIDVLTAYDRIVFVDAHIYRELDDLCCTSVSPEFDQSTFTHHMTPAMILALLKELYRREPAGHIVSVPGRDFDFHRGLSLETGILVNKAVECILTLIACGEMKLGAA